MDNHVCDIANIDVVLDEEILTPYVDDCYLGMARGIDKTMKGMVVETKATAPVENHKWTPTFPDHNRGAAFKKAITWKKEGHGMQHSATWYVRSPEYRLTHLLENGHEQFIFGKPTGKRARAHEFVLTARDHAEIVLIPNIKEELNK